MTDANQTRQHGPPPQVLWAQRPGLVLLTICLEDCKAPEIRVEADSLYFRGTGGTDKSEHEVTIGFLKEIVPDDSKYAVRDRVIEFALKKKEEETWPRLLKDKTKQHWLKVDFNKWKDEDDSDDEAANNKFGGPNADLEEMMRSMGGLSGGGGVPGMGADFERPNLDDLDNEDSDDDDKDLPDLE